MNQPLTRPLHATADANPLPKRIRQLRESLGLSPSQAAYVVHVPPGTWRQWEEGRKQMPVETFSLFCRKTR